jgi:phage terminase large subunit
MREQINADINILPVYWDAFNWTGEYLVLIGGAGSGKSYFIAQKLIARCMANPGERILLIRKVYKTCHASVYQQVKDVMAHAGISKAARFRDSTSDVFFHNGSMMATVGMDDLDKIKSIAGITSAWFEEAQEGSEEDFNEIDRRIRGENPPSYFQLCMSLNPLPTGRWIKDLFVDQQYPNALVINTTVDDNPRIGANYTEKLDRIRDETEREIFRFGLWGAFTKGIIYPEWSTAPFPEVEDIYYGLDFGFESPAAVVACTVIDRSPRPRLHVHELVYEAGLTNAMLAQRMKQAGYVTGKSVYCDNAEPKSILELQQEGINAVPADKSVAEGIKRVQEHEIVFTPSSVNLHREVSMYRRAPDTSRYAEDGTFQEDPIKKNDHGMDAMRYAVFSRTKHWFVYD